jgi:Uma2 family endonuclease
LARALPDDGKRYEVLDGELFVTPAPSLLHQRALAALLEIVAPYVRQHALGETFLAPADIEFSPRRMLQPDLFVVPLSPRGRAREWADVRSLLLAVEALSPSTARADRHNKRIIYQGEGVPEYWIIDLDARLAERWRPGDERPEILIESLVWSPHASVAPLEIDLVGFFGSILDEGL